MTGFNNLGSPEAVCWSNGTFSLFLGNSLSNVIVIQQINITTSNSTKTVSFNKQLYPGFSSTFNIGSVCPKTSGQSYSVNANVYYTEPGQLVKGPYYSYGSASGATETG